MKLIEFIKKNKLYILGLLVLIFFFRSCSRGRTITKMEKETVRMESKIDSLQTINKIQSDSISKFPETLRKERLSIYLSLDDTISRVDRSPQLMGLHQMIKDSVKNLTK